MRRVCWTIAELKQLITYTCMGGPYGGHRHRTGEGSIFVVSHSLYVLLLLCRRRACLSTGKVAAGRLGRCVEAVVYNAVQPYKLPHLLRHWE